MIFISAPVSATCKAWALATTGYAGESRLKRLKQQLRWAFYASMNARSIQGWFSFLQTPDLALYVKLNHYLALKPLRVYISHKWDIDRKIRVLENTYEFIALAGSPLQNAITRAEGVRLACFPVTDELNGYVQLGYDNKYRKEGELVASIWCPELGGVIISLAFSFERGNDGEWSMYIGCVQGRNGVDNKLISKGMHGLWPKAFIVYIAQEIAGSFGVRHIFGVGNDIHSHKKKRMVYIASRHRLAFDYDSLWEDAGGKLAPDGFFEIPVHFQRRLPENMKSSKRSMYVRRYSLLDDISAQIRASLL